MFQDGSGGRPTSPRTPGARRGPSPPGGATRSGRTEDSPPRETVASGAGGPGPRARRPPRRLPAGPREGTAAGAAAGSRRGGRARRRSSPSAPGCGESCCRRAVTPAARRGRRVTCPAEAFPADPEPVAAHRPGGNAPDGGRRRPGGGPLPEPPSPRGGGGREGIRRPGPADRSRRVESSGRTARTPPVYLLTVSRPLELSLQSSFQLSLTVLVDYRSRAGI